MIGIARLDRTLWACAVVGFASIACCAVVAAGANADISHVFTGASELLSLRMGYLGWELAFVFGAAAELLRRRRTQLPAALLRHGSLFRWVRHEIMRWTALAAMYVVVSVGLVTAILVIAGPSPAWTLPGLVQVTAGGVLQFAFYSIAMMIVLLLWPQPSSALIAIAGILVLATLAPSLPFLLPVQASATLRWDGTWQGVWLTFATLFLASGAALAALGLRHRLRPIDL